MSLKGKSAMEDVTGAQRREPTLPAQLPRLQLSAGRNRHSRATHLVERGLDVARPHVDPPARVLDDRRPKSELPRVEGGELHAVVGGQSRDEDLVHAAGLKAAFQHARADPLQFAVAREVFKNLERVTDAFEDVANQIDGIVIDHA